MRSLWIIVFIAACTNAQYENDPDYWQDYNEWYDSNLDISENFNDNAPDLVDVPNQPQESVQNDDTIKEDNDGAILKDNLGQSNEEPEFVDDYQIEDNRSDAKELLAAVNEEPRLNIEDNLIKKILENDNNDDEAKHDFEVFQKLNEDRDNIDDKVDINDLLPEDNKNNVDELVDLPLLENVEKKLNSNEDDISNLSSEDQLPEIQINVQPDADEIIEDTRKILAEIDNQFESNDGGKDEEPKNSNEELLIPDDDNNEEISKPLKEDELNVEKLSESDDSLSNIDTIIDETRKILAESDNQFENSETGNLDFEKNVEELVIPEDENNEEISKPFKENELNEEILPETDNSLHNINEIIDETHKILSESENQFENNETGNLDSLKKADETVFNEEENNEEISNIVNSLSINEIIGETHKILEDSGNKFEDSLNNNNDQSFNEDIKYNSEEISNPEYNKNEEISKISNEEISILSEDKPLEVNPPQSVAEVIEEARKILEESSSQFENEETNKNINNLDENVISDEEMKKIIEETLNALDDNNGQIDANGLIRDKSYESDNKLDMESVIEETNKLLEENANNFDVDIGSNEKHAEGEFISKESINENDDNLDGIYKDLQVDLDSLLHTWEKLSNDDIDLDEENPDDALDNDDVLDYEEKYGRPYGEGKVLSQRDDYYESIDDNNLSKLFADQKSEEVKPADDEAVQKVADSVVESNVENVVDNEENKDSPILYVNDALVAGDNNAEPKPESETNEPVKTMSIEKLSDSELEQLTSQFMILHADEINTKSDNFNRDVAPIHIKLSVDEPTVITSPNYPNPYPTNNIIDWILDGEGVGIELNITDFIVNSALGDYLLVKPGSIDDSGDNGLIFAHHLNEERRYRFMDVDQLFIRFDSKPGMMFRRGFQLSVRMIAPPREEEPELPEPEPVVPAPNATMTVYLAGLNVTGFEEVREEFRQILASMATMYINANDIDPGTNSTSFVTQITRTYICNINWPGYEDCVEVKFSVPLVYDDDREHRLNETDLHNMWYTYVSRDPFATRLRSLGISEFTTPNDGATLMLWLILLIGVLACVMILAFALWKFSCLENYTRMQSYSDTDSVHNEKSHLGMYPTPHQTLPPLFTESNYKWHDSNFEDTTRVDMGGFANRSYVRDEPSDDSDVDTVTVTRNSMRGHPDSRPNPNNNIV